MTNSDPNIVGAEKRAEFFRDFIQAVLSLAAGSIVFSVTFLHDVVGIGKAARAAAPSVMSIPRAPSLLLLAWSVLTVSVIASIVFLYVHAVSTKYTKAYSWQMQTAAVIASSALVLGLIFLAIFGYLNVAV